MSDGQKPAILSRETLIPIGFAISIAGGLVWLTTMYTDIKQLKSDQERSGTRIEQVASSQRMSDDRLLRLEAKADQILEKVTQIQKAQ